METILTKETGMKKILLLIAMVLGAAPVTVQAQSVKVHYDESVDFTKFKNYSWTKGLPASSPQIHRFIVQEIDRQLLSKGLSRVEVGGDLNLTYYASLDENLNIGAVEYMKNSDYQKWGEHEPVYGPKMVGMLMAKMVFDVVDASTNKLIWRGRAKDAYTPNQARGQKRAHRALEKLFARFPLPSIQLIRG
jgi:hypothetical protein